MGVPQNHADHKRWGPYGPDGLHNGPEEGKGYELWNGWLIEKMSPSARHNRVSANLREIFKDAARRAGADVFIDGGEYEFVVPTGIRKPDVFILDADAERAACEADELYINPADLFVVAEVVSPRSGSEPHDRVFKRDEYAKVGIPQYWIVDFKPVPRIEVLELNAGGVYETVQVATGEEVLVVARPFEMTVTPSVLLGLDQL